MEPKQRWFFYQLLSVGMMILLAVVLWQFLLIWAIVVASLLMLITAEISNDENDSLESVINFNGAVFVVSLTIATIYTIASIII